WEGARVVLVDCNPDRLEVARKMVEQIDAEHLAVEADVRVEADIERAVNEAGSRFGRLDVMFANAGVRGKRQGAVTIDEATDQDASDVFDTNFTGVFYSVKHAVRHMKDTGGGSIVVTSSAAALRAYPKTFMYA